MNPQYYKLCSIHIGHLYYIDALFSGYKISPTDECHALLIKYGLLIKFQPNGFSIFYATPFEGIHRDRELILKTNILLQFRFQIIDPYFFVCTGNLPDNLVKNKFQFSNFDKKQQIRSASDLLHHAEFVSETEMIPSTDAMNYFGDIEIRFDSSLNENLFIRFLNRSTYWRYIFITGNFKEFEKLAILDKLNQHLFSGPELIELPDGRKGKTFTSSGKIALMERSEKQFQLVDNSDEKTKQFGKVLIPRLPVPDQSTNVINKDGKIISEIMVYL